jgi:hypothetical protein
MGEYRVVLRKKTPAASPAAGSVAVAVTSSAPCFLFAVLWAFSSAFGFAVCASFPVVSILEENSRRIRRRTDQAQFSGLRR